MRRTGGAIPPEDLEPKLTLINYNVKRAAGR